jgi:hypothetical protein
MDVSQMKHEHHAGDHEVVKSRISFAVMAFPNVHRPERVLVRRDDDVQRRILGKRAAAEVLADRLFIFVEPRAETLVKDRPLVDGKAPKDAHRE